jgi:hypothetical protein
MIISIGPQEVFAEKGDDKKKDDYNEKQKEKIQNLKEKIVEKVKDKFKKIKDKITEKLKKKFDKIKDKKDNDKNYEELDYEEDIAETEPEDNVHPEPVDDVESESGDENYSSTPLESVDDIQVFIPKTKQSANDNAPFFGTDSFGNRYIDNGFSFNDFKTDIEDYRTHMPLQTIQVGESNTAVLKIYNHKGVSTLEHVELVFGFGQKQSDGQSNSIIWEQNFKGTQFVTTNDPDNMLMDVNAVGEADDKVMSVTFSFAFREPMEKSKIGVIVWDKDRNSRTAYFNDGIEVVGESLNPPEIITVLDGKGYPVKITMIGKNTGVDEEGNIWTHNSPWIKQGSASEKHPSEEHDPVTYHGFDRNHSMFASYKDIQAQEAQQKLMELLGGHNIYNFND